MDFGLLADSTAGVTLVGAPGARSEQGRHPRVIWLRFDPDSLIPWLDLAAAYLNEPPREQEPEGIRWAPRLAPIRGTGGISFGRKIRHRQWLNVRYFMIADSVDNWIVEITPDQSRTFLNELLEVGSLSRYVAPTAEHDTAQVHLPGDVDVKPSVVSQPQTSWLGTDGRVVLQFVIDTTGAPEMNTFLAVIASDSTLEAEARRVIAGSRFHPGRRDGRPVRTLVDQTISWLSR
jgi:hypothetical protein